MFDNLSDILLILILFILFYKVFENECFTLYEDDDKCYYFNKFDNFIFVFYNFNL